MTTLYDGAEGRNFAGWSVVLKLGIFVLTSINQLITVDAQAWAATTWTNAHATFYGGQDASGTMGGACGYGNLYSSGYGIYTGALSVALFNNGLSCGACFQIMCQTDQTLYGVQYCYPGRSITITATNLCPNGSFGGWCDAPKLHFDLSYPMFTSLAQEVAGVIPIQYRRVQCTKWGGVIFNLQGNSYFFLVLVTNVAGKGDVAGMSMKSDSTSGWLTMSQNWGQNWELDNHPELVGKPLSFLVTLGNGQSIYFYQVMPATWSFGSSYQSPYNFY